LEIDILLCFCLYTSCVIHWKQAGIDPLRSVMKMLNHHPLRRVILKCFRRLCFVVASCNKHIGGSLL